MLKIVIAFIIGISFYGFLCYYQPIIEAYSEQKNLEDTALNSQLTPPPPLQ